MSDDTAPSHLPAHGSDADGPGVRPIVRAQALCKTHHGEGGPVHAVRSVDLTVQPGEFVAVTGPSGAGKSTLLHLLGGLQRPDSGQLWLDGERVDGYREARWAGLRRRNIGIVFQFFNLVSNLTVADNVELPALLAGASPGRRATAAPNSWPSSGSKAGSARCPANCPAASSSASRWPGHW